MGEISVWLCIYSLVQFWSLFQKIIILVPKPRRLNLVFFYVLESFYLCYFDLLLIIFCILIIGSPNNSQ
jgi:hypothetical protein